MNNPFLWWFALVISLVILVASWRLAVTTNLIKDDSKGSKKPYSFARVQLLWWTLIVSISYVFLYAQREEFTILNSSILILLGISAATGGFARVVDASQETSDLSRHQNQSSDGFLVDILSDANGISIHRLQNLIFTILYGLIMIYRVFHDGQMPVFGESELFLMGISSGTYLGIKTTENSIKVPDSKEKFYENPKP